MSACLGKAVISVVLAGYELRSNEHYSLAALPYSALSSEKVRYV